MASSTRLIASILVIAALAVVFWMLALSPKRKEADELGQQVNQLKLSLGEAESAAQTAEGARRNFPTDYRQLVVLGQAVPAGDETSSLLVELNKIAARANASFESIQLTASGEESTAAVPEAVAPAPTTPSAGGATGVPASESIPPTEAAAALLPLGASIGSAGLGVMPYSVSFKGDFFQIADLIEGIDSLVRTSGSKISVDGRLLTLSGFSLAPEAEGKNSSRLQASFTLTSYLTPPSQGVTAGASATAPPTTVPATEGETAEAPPAEGSASAETVSAK